MGMRPLTLRTMSLAAAAVTSVALIAGCSNNDNGSSSPRVPTVTPASAAPAPTTATAPAAGTIVTLPAPGKAVAVDDAAGVVAVLAADGSTVWLTDAKNVAAAPRAVTTKALTRLIVRPTGGFLGVGPSTVATIAPDGAVTEHPLSATDPLSIAQLPDGHILVGTATGRLIELDRDFREVAAFGGLVRADDIGVAGDQVVVLDRAQSSVTQVKLADKDLGLALRAGNGATTMITDHYGRFLVANPRDNEIIGFYGNPLVMRFRAPVADGPYALAYDNQRDLLWVSVTGSNQVVAYDLASGEPREQRRLPTVAQPDAMAVDSDTGALYVMSARAGQLAVVTR